ncbi:hypothetical protein BS78_06G222800 [Paspalum vaginatum]|nr:hypothetical protein BS78_06G222800 [Paspalum vaginatum]KAJ1272702.1 hypothetical protein BS78_06G222800 [Paspalum vaginatum]
MFSADSSDTPTPVDSNSNPSVQESTEVRTRKKTDPAWDYCTQFVEEGKKKIKCMYCNAVFGGGGIHRFKEHLAKYPGNVAACPKVDPEVEYAMNNHIEEWKAKKRKADEDYQEEQPGEETAACEVSNNSTAPARCAAASRGRKRGTSTPGIGKYYQPRTNPGDQPKIKSVLQGEAVKQKTDLCVAKWFIDASISFNASNSIFYQPMIDAVCAYGSGYKGPNFNQLRGPLLAKCVEETRSFVDGFRKTWRETGCTVMADGWTDRKRRTLINFLVYCPKGTVFLKTVDASQSSKTADFLFKLFRGVVNFVGPENVVHFVTDNASNMVAAGRMLQDEFPSIYWSPCAAHCLNLILSDFGKEEIVKRTVAHASSITKYIYNHCYPLFLMRKFSKGQEILRPAQTRFATNFVALQSIYKHKADLHAMVISNEWTSCAYYKEARAKKFTKSVLDQSFWKDCAIVCQLSEPIVRVLRIVDSDERPAMGYLFAAFHASREEIVKRFQRKKEFVKPFLSYIDARWDRHFDKNLHAAGFWFNPNNQYNDELREKYNFTTSGVLDVIEKYAGKDIALRSNLTREMRIFRKAEGDFGRSTAKNDRQHMLADEWWQTYGCSAPNLQKLALRVLSQTCSASACERNWSLFEHVHSKKRNRLEHQRLSDIVYVHCNLRLHNRSKKTTRNYDPISLEEIRKGNEAWIVEDNPPRLTSEELNEFRGELAALSIQCSDDLVLNLDEAEADAMEESEAMVSNQENVRNQENIIDDLEMSLGEDFETSPHNTASDPEYEDDWGAFY